MSSASRPRSAVRGDQAVGCRAEPDDFDPGQHLDAARREDVGEDRADRRLFVRQQALGRLHQGDAHAERGEEVGQFAADRATAENQQ
jgi:hypothetical protein